MKTPYLKKELCSGKTAGRVPFSFGCKRLPAQSVDDGWMEPDCPPYMDIVAKIMILICQ
ncbi:hypothetical protein CLOSTASPAR_02318 [[Clostridium] asparagiforme DSM 15981]|uniref:Uncharacterized protein n=1 Tax=[Clostridium] asparagiforme DSM 15981 TaxID=518636 RepID=C0CZ91_9FIRM|nr:hypothetical protein CLOSTASPAR_02318 [[Clostridium] asparagiforme DSM 15981]